MTEVSAAMTGQARDGMMMQELGNDTDGYDMYAIGGWNGVDIDPVTPGPQPTSNQVFICNDPGLYTTWTQIGIMPLWCHTFVFEVDPNNRMRAIMYASDGYDKNSILYVVEKQADKSLTFTVISLTSAETALLANRILMGGAYFQPLNGWVIGGGQVDVGGAGYFNDVLLLEDNGSFWSLTQIATGLTHLEGNLAGAWCTDGTYLYQLFTGKYDDVNGRTYHPYWYRTADMVTWTNMGTLPGLSYYGNAFCWKGMVWSLFGGNTTGNVRRIVYWDGSAWHDMEMDANYRPRHASAVAVSYDTDMVVIGPGNLDDLAFVMKALL